MNDKTEAPNRPTAPAITGPRCHPDIDPSRLREVVFLADLVTVWQTNADDHEQIDALTFQLVDRPDERATFWSRMMSLDRIFGRRAVALREKLGTTPTGWTAFRTVSKCLVAPTDIGDDYRGELRIARAALAFEYGQMVPTDEGPLRQGLSIEPARAAIAKRSEHSSTPFVIEAALDVGLEVRLFPWFGSFELGKVSEARREVTRARVIQQIQWSKT